MLSRIYRRFCEVQKRLFLKHQPAFAASTAGAEKPSLPAESGQRDLVNFPRRVRPEYAPPTRMLFIPETWFQYLYPKTGVTGPYVLGLGVAAFLLSKEIVLYHSVASIASFCIIVYLTNSKYGDKIGSWYNAKFDEYTEDIDKLQNWEKELIKRDISQLEQSYVHENVLDEILKAKRENILMQMESSFRERMVKVYAKIKKNLDYQVELENAQKRIAQKNIEDYVIRNVLSSITAEHEKSTMQICIQNLNALAAKA